MVMKSDLELVKHKVDSMGSDMRQLRNMMEMLLSQNASRITTQGDPSQPGPSRPYVPLSPPTPPSPPPPLSPQPPQQVQWAEVQSMAESSASIVHERRRRHEENEDKQELRQRFYALKPRNQIVAEYIAEFDDLRKRCGFRKDCENTIAWFIRGLPKKIAREVELKQYKKLGEVYECALEVEKQRALAKMPSSKPCTTTEQSAKCEVSVAERESTTPNELPPPPTSPNMNHVMLPPPSLKNQELPSPPPPPSSQVMSPPHEHELPPPPSLPTSKPQPHIEEDSGLSIEVSKDVVVCGEKGSYKEDVVERVASVEVVNVGIVVNMPSAMVMSSLKELFEWLSGRRSEIIIFKNYLLLMWENLTRVKMKENGEF